MKNPLENIVVRQYLQNFQTQLQSKAVKYIMILGINVVNSSVVMDNNYFQNIQILARKISKQIKQHRVQQQKVFQMQKEVKIMNENLNSPQQRFQSINSINSSEIRSSNAQSKNDDSKQNFRDSQNSSKIYQSPVESYSSQKSKQIYEIRSPKQSDSPKIKKNYTSPIIPQEKLNKKSYTPSTMKGELRPPKPYLNTKYESMQKISSQNKIKVSKSQNFDNMNQISSQNSSRRGSTQSEEKCQHRQMSPLRIIPHHLKNIQSKIKDQVRKDKLKNSSQKSKQIEANKTDANPFIKQKLIEIMNLKQQHEQFKISHQFTMLQNQYYGQSIQQNLNEYRQQNLKDHRQQNLNEYRQQNKSNSQQQQIQQQQRVQQPQNQQIDFQDVSQRQSSSTQNNQEKISNQINVLNYQNPPNQTKESNQQKSQSQNKQQNPHDFNTILSDDHSQVELSNNKNYIKYIDDEINQYEKKSNFNPPYSQKIQEIADNFLNSPLLQHIQQDNPSKLYSNQTPKMNLDDLSNSVSKQSTLKNPQQPFFNTIIDKNQSIQQKQNTSQDWMQQESQSSSNFSMFIPNEELKLFYKKEFNPLINTEHSNQFQLQGSNFSNKFYTESNYNQ